VRAEGVRPGAACQVRLHSLPQAPRRWLCAERASQPTACPYESVVHGMAVHAGAAPTAAAAGQACLGACRSCVRLW
jgi:hypothetical protein